MLGRLWRSKVKEKFFIYDISESDFANNLHPFESEKAAKDWLIETARNEGWDEEDPATLRFEIFKKTKTLQLVCKRSIIVKEL